MKLIRTKDIAFAPLLSRILEMGRGGSADVLEDTVKGIIRDVRKNKDRALVKYTRRFDRVDISGRIEVRKADLRGAAGDIPKNDLLLMKLAAKRIEAFHRRQRQSSWSVRGKNGITLGQKITPLEKVGIYVPGGKASYPTSVLMNALPARIAGVDEIVMATPPSKQDINPYVLAAAYLGGVTRVYRIGGAQAIAALAFGTETVLAVDKIVGPGNIYVATAKRLVFGKVDIDMVAGPSEILIINDGTGNPAFIASDLLSQAEHDEDARSALITTSLSMATAVKKEVEKRLKGLKRKAIAKTSIERNGLIIVAKTVAEAAKISNLIAPEHLELIVERPESLLGKIRNAGAIFLGPYTPEAAGDYLAGPNHTLPTAGTARFSSPLGVHDFLKASSVIKFSKKALEKLGPAIERLAELEGLDGHAKSVKIRFEKNF